MKRRLSQQDILVILSRLRHIWRHERKARMQSVPLPYVSETVDVGENKITLFNRGVEVYEIMKELFLNAKHEILIDSFIFSGDELGEDFQKILDKKIKEGVNVTVILDPIGNIFTTPSYWHNFRQKRFKIKEINSYKELWNIFTLNLLFRDHRKLIVVDGKVAFLGGLNISAKYQKNWRDTHIMIEGLCVTELRMLFNEVYKGRRIKPLFGNVEKKKLEAITFINKFPKETPNRFLQTVLNLIETASHEIFLNQIYFVPDRKILHALVDAVKRGVSVKLLISEFSDVNFVQSAVLYHANWLQKRGVDVNMYLPCVNHSKTLVVDKKFSLIGSGNMDNRSLEKNYEIFALINNESFAEKMLEMHALDFSQSRKWSSVDWKKRSIYDKTVSIVAVFFRRFL